MELTSKLIFRINAALKPLACDCFDLRGKTRTGCAVCGGKGGMAGCSTCLGAGMCPDAGMQVRRCVSCGGRGYLFHEFTPEMRSLIAKKRIERARAVTSG